MFLLNNSYKIGYINICHHLKGGNRRVYITSKCPESMEFTEFEEFGLTKNEAKAYQVLIQFGKLSAGETSSKSGVPYGRIYDVLESLTRKGLVAVIPEKTKKFMPGNPDAFLKILEEKEKSIANAKEKVKEMKQFYDVKEKNPVIMGLGKNAFYKIGHEMKEVKKYAYSIRWSSEYKPEWVEETKKELKKKIDVKFLVHYDDKTKKDVNDWLKIHKNIRKIENDGVAMSIIDDQEVLISIIRSNSTLLIRDKPFAKIMRQLYTVFYEKANPIRSHLNSL